MKILMLTPYLPFPLESGGQTRSYNLLKNLAPKHKITLFSFIREERERENVVELKKFCEKVLVFSRRRAWSPLNVFLAGFSSLPFLVAIYYSRAVLRAVKTELERSHYDLIHAETFYVMPNLPKTDVPMLLVEQTVEYLVYQHFVENFRFSPLKPLLYLDVAKLKAWERRYWQKADKVVAMSGADKKMMRREIPRLDVDIVPNGVDVEYFSSIKPKRGKKEIILFVGNFKWLQNREAVDILVGQVWPLIKREKPKAKLWIVGRNPTRVIRKFASESVKVDESVKDIRQAYQNADVLLAPMKGGGGTRLKVLEAMISGVPVVTTSIGIEGIEVKDGKHVLVRDRPDSLASATIDVLDDTELAKRLADEAKKLVAQRYSWRSLAAELDQVYQEVARGKN